MDINLPKNIILTGASGAIGQALARELASHGACLLLHGRNREPLDILANEFPEKIHVLTGDLAREETITALFEAADQFWGREGIHAVIHNAAPPVSGDSAVDIQRKEADLALTVGPATALDLIRNAASRMERGGRIILTSSGAGHNGFADMPAYCAAKFALEGIAQAAAEDLWKKGISINTVALPSVKTPFSQPHFSPEQFETFPEPKDVLTPFLMLLAPENDRFSGRSVFLHEHRCNDHPELPPLRKYRCMQPALLPPDRRDLLQDGYQNDMAKVDLGEAPFPPSPRVAETVSAWMNGPNTQEYPDAACRDLKEVIAQQHNVAPDCILPGPGSSEVLAWLLDTLVDPGSDVISGSFCFRIWSWMVQTRGIRHILYHNNEVHHDLIQVLTKITPQTRLIYIDSPSNPMGDVILEQQFRYFMHRLPSHIWVVVDHAYQDFVVDSNGLDTTTSEWLQDRRILSVRTLSKSHAMAAWRIGYLAAHPDTINAISGHIHPFQLSTPTQLAAIAALEDNEYTLKLRQHYISERQRIRTQLDKLRIPYWLGETSFTAVYWPGVSSCYEAAKKAGIAIPHADNDLFFIAAIRDIESNNRVLTFLEKHYPEEHRNK